MVDRKKKKVIDASKPDETSGKVSGIERAEVEAIGTGLPSAAQAVGARIGKTAQQVRANSPEAAAESEALRQRTGEALANIGNVQTEFPELEEAPLDVGQAITSGVVKNVIPSAIGYAGTGAAIGAAGGSVIPGAGTAAGAGLGAAIGATVGIVKGFYQGVVGNIESQKKGEIAASVDVLSAGRTNMRQLAMLASQDPANAESYLQQYNEQLVQLHKARAQIKLETSENLDKFIEDGTDILSDFDLYLQEGGTADIYGQKLKIAIQSNTPLTLGDFGGLE